MVKMGIGSYIKNGIMYGFIRSGKDWTEQVIVEFRRIPLDGDAFKDYAAHSTAKDKRGHFDSEGLVKELIHHMKNVPGSDNDVKLLSFYNKRIAKWLLGIIDYINKLKKPNKVHT